jgi:DNA-binding CsgD family transcriptional regulator
VVEALVDASGFALHPLEGEGQHLRASRERSLSAVRGHLGDAAFAAAWDAGRALPPEQGMAEALDPGDVAGAPVAPPPSPDPAAALGLTPREGEVLRWLVQGLSDREIAEELFISPRTVQGHVAGLLAKLGLASRAAAAAYAVRYGLA